MGSKMRVNLNMIHNRYSDYYMQDKQLSRLLCCGHVPVLCI